MRSIQHHVHVLLARSAMGDPNIDQRLAKDQRRQRRSRLPILLPSTDGDVIALGVLSGGMLVVAYLMIGKLL